jgi:hypothetical protein
VREVTEPRCLTRRQAADYAGCKSLSAFSDRIRRGILPGPVTGTRVWDRRAIDAALDRASGISAASQPVESLLDQWKRQRAAKQVEADKWLRDEERAKPRDSVASDVTAARNRNW